MRIAITGSTGRLGVAVTALARDRGAHTVMPWTRVDFDLDAPDTVGLALDRDRPDLVVHCAAWTDVDGCAREPELALQRNGVATGKLAQACAERGIGLVAISSNEVFDGSRTDGMPYLVTDRPSPPNPYGRSKRLAEELAAEAFAAVRTARLWIVRTAWLFGPPGNDFPMKILAAGRAARAEGRALPLVADEIGSPTYALDLAAAVLDLAVHEGSAGLHHVINAGSASRASWGRLVLDRANLGVRTYEVAASTWARPSTPPKWGVLAQSPLPTLPPLRPWSDALVEYLDERLARDSESSEVAN